MQVTSTYDRPSEFRTQFRVWQVCERRLSEIAAGWYVRVCVCSCFPKSAVPAGKTVQFHFTASIFVVVVVIGLTLLIEARPVNDVVRS